MENVHLLILIILSIELLSSAASPGQLPQRKVKCSAFRIPNGLYSMRRRDTILRITCQHGYVLFGTKSVECINGRWDGETPVCAKKGCSKKPNTPKDGFIQMEDELKATLFCRDNYKIAGGRVTYCNGSDWDRPLGTCREIKTTIQLGCDFESDDVCGWVYDEYGAVSWKRTMAANMFLTLRTGPQHDHTTMTANGGHYMLMESFTTRRDATAQLISPIYSRELSLRTACCFRFYYFMYGATVGSLNVYVRPISVDIAAVLDDRKYLYFSKIGNQNNIWNEGIFDIEEMSEDFQIIFIGSSGNSHLSDIAIDDVQLMTGVECRPAPASESPPSSPVHKAAASGASTAANVEDDTISSSSPFELTSNITVVENNSSSSSNNNTRDESQAIYDVQSCEFRCTETSPMGLGVVIKNGLFYKTCDCHPGCGETKSCCPNYHTICVLGDDSFATVMEAMQSSSPFHVDMGNFLPNVTTKATKLIVQKPSTNITTTATTTATTTTTTTAATTTTTAKKPITKLTTATKRNKNSTAKTTTTTTTTATTTTPKTTKSTAPPPTTPKTSTTTIPTSPITTTTTTTTTTPKTATSTPPAGTTALPSGNQENNQPHQEQHRQQSSKSIATPIPDEMPSTSFSSDLLDNSMTTRTTEFYLSMSTRPPHRVNHLTPPTTRKQIIWKIKTEKHRNANRRQSNSILLTIMAIISGIVLTAIVLGAIYHRYARVGGNGSNSNINWNQNEEGSGSVGGAISTETGSDMIAIGRRSSSSSNNNNNNSINHNNNNNIIRSNNLPFNSRNRRTIWQKFLRQMFARSTNNGDSDDSSYNSDFLDTASLIYSSHEDEILLHTPAGGVPVSTL